MKVCRDCKQEKDLNSFIKNKLSPEGIDSLCIECNKRRVKEWRKLHPEKRKLQQKLESKASKIYNVRKHLKHTYGITVEEYDSMYTQQNGCCAICGIHQSESKTKFHVDHCHTTGKIRGLLCQHCNHLLGRAKDSRVILKKAIEYLDKTETGY